MNCSVWAAQAAQAVRKKDGFEFFWATFEGVFFKLFVGKKYYSQKNIGESALKSCIKESLKTFF
mgnify:CR=1 FL=1